eukprot:TRINITY_DN18253_c0_g2_i1.p1 TRINITY_DN18253_c0_g2~~TRINITY_DN18253_c0_g2_i1.p1  ORF type:complete len:857 (+),score=184.54 TRINITY_DN18253_c0_g2_i1:119-2689(+)
MAGRSKGELAANVVVAGSPRPRAAFAMAIGCGGAAAALLWRALWRRRQSRSSGAELVRQTIRSVEAGAGASTEPAIARPEDSNVGAGGQDGATGTAGNSGDVAGPVTTVRPVEAPTTGAPRERPMGLRTLLMALQACDRVSPESVLGPFQVNSGEEDAPVVCFQFRMSHFTCKAYLAHGTHDEGSQHLKLHTMFEDNRRTLGEEQRYFVANEWNATKRYTRLRCGSGGGVGRSSVFTLEYDVLVPADTPHSWGLSLVSQTLRMWYTSMVACVMHIVEPRDIPFATHDMITANTLDVTVREEDTALLQEACPICFESFRVGEKVRRLPCMHIFHVVGADKDTAQGTHCSIDRHLTCDKQCPVCKTPIDIMVTKDVLSMETAGERTTDAASAAAANADPLAVATATVVALPVGGGIAPAAAGDAAVTDVTPGSDGGERTLLAPGAVDAGNRLASANATMAAVANALVGAAGIAVPGVGGEPGGAGAGGGAGGLGDGVGGALVAAASARGGGTTATRALGAAAAAGLPAQAAELEQAVRSLQMRWLQIQDVVAGMQQMLQYIEESQSAIGAARAAEAALVEATGGGGGGETEGPPVAALVVASGDGSGDDSQAQQQGSPQHTPQQETQSDQQVEGGHDVEGDGGGHEAPAGEIVGEIHFVASREEPRSMDEALRVAREVIASQPPMSPRPGQPRTATTSGNAADATAAAGGSPPVSEAAATATLLDVAAMLAQRAAALSQHPSLGIGQTTEATDGGSQPLPRVAEATAPPHGVVADGSTTAEDGAHGSTSSIVAGGSPEVVGPLLAPRPMVARAPPATRDWQPFTEVEKVCMAYAWRQRRVAAAEAMAGANPAEIERPE